MARRWRELFAVTALGLYEKAVLPSAVRLAATYSRRDTAASGNMTLFTRRPPWLASVTHL